MKDMIQKIVDMDKKAQKLDKKNQAQRENLEKEIQEITSNIHSEYMAEAKKTAEKNMAEIKSEAEQKWKNDEKKRAAVMQQLQKNYEEKKEQWVNAIVERVLS